MNAPMIGAATCANCGHSAIQNDRLVCAHSPPTATPLIAYVETIEIGAGKEMRVLKPQPRGFVTAFPPVEPGIRCGQHKRQLLSIAPPDDLRAGSR
jgi:hypothetical protein